MGGGVGEPGGFTEFCRREYPRLVGVLSLRVHDVHLAEELAQEALTRACDRWAKVSEMAAPGAWVHRVAMNLAGSWFRRRAAERRANTRAVSRPEHADPDTADVVAVRGALLGLPVAQRTVLGLRYYAGLSVAETAEVMSTTEDAVKAHTRRAVAGLRDRFLPEEVSHE